MYHGAGEYDEDEPKKPPSTLRATDIKVTGHPLDPTNMGRIIKPRELVDIIELTPLNRNETILYNQLLAHSWNDIKTKPVHKVLKASLRGTHESNDRLHDAFDRLMSAWAKIRARDPATGEMATFRVHLLGTNKEEDKDDGYFYYTFPPDLLAVISQSRAWATIKSHIMYALRSKYSIRLYEMIERRIGLMKQHEVLSIDEFRALLGVPEGKLERFADFNKHCLKPALDEFNHLTDFIVQIASHQERPIRRDAAADLVQEITGRNEGCVRRAREKPRRPPGPVERQRRDDQVRLDDEP